MRVSTFGWLLLLLLPGASGAQSNIPFGSWRMHISFNNLVGVVDGGEYIYAAAANGVIKYHKSERSIEVFHKGNGLSNVGITTIAFDDVRGNLMIAYDNGTFDVIRNSVVSSFDPTRNTVLTGPKKINDITVLPTLAYFSTDYGVLVFDLERSEIRETWRDLGPGGSTLTILASTFFQDSVFLATEQGVIAGDLNDNLLDYNKWERFTESDLVGPVTAIAAFQNTIVATASGGSFYAYENGTWIQENWPVSGEVTGLFASSEFLLATTDEDVFGISPEGAVAALQPGSALPALDAIRDDNGTIWIASARSGLVVNTGGDFLEILPNGPGRNEVTDLIHYDGTIYMLSGGYSPEFEPLNRPGTIDYFRNGEWSREELPVPDVTGLAFKEGGRFISSYGYGVLAQTGGPGILYDESNSTLFNASPAEREVFVTGLAATSEGIFVANYNAFPSLHFLDLNGTWQAFSLPYTQSRFPVKLVADRADNVWAILDSQYGGGIIVFNRREGVEYFLTTQDEQGELPSNVVYALKEDRDGNVWVGTDAGVAYFYDVRSDAVKPLFENRFLLRDDRVKAIAVDGGNRKWMGTERGVWLFNATGEEALANFTTANSPLPSDNIIDIEIDPRSGEVFFATDRGIVSFRSDATDGKNDFDVVKIAPNPVTPAFSGWVGISGLATDAIVKITDVSGKLVWQTKANGGTASWHVKDHSGNRVNTGIYLVFAVLQDGSESVVGKIAVIN